MQILSHRPLKLTGDELEFALQLDSEEESRGTDEDERKSSQHAGAPKVTWEGVATYYMTLFLTLPM